MSSDDAQGKSPTKIRMTPNRWIITGTVLILLAGTGAYASAGYYRHRVHTVEAENSLVYQGVSVDGSRVSGLTKKKLGDRVAALTKKKESEMKLTIVIDGERHTYSAKDLGITFDTSAAAESAWTCNKPKTEREKRLAAIGMWQPIPKNIAVHWKLSKTGLVPKLAKELSGSANRAPIDERMALSGPAPTISKGTAGRRVSEKAIIESMNRAIRKGNFGATIAIKPATVPAKPIADTHSIVINRKAHTVTLYDRSNMIKQYPCAVGQPEFPTPTGDFLVESKQVNPTWVNPHNAWSSGMPETIPGGPESPLGQRALALNAPGVLIHGIPASEYSSIGTDASHGCIRMMPGDISDLFDKVNARTQVFIR